MPSCEGRLLALRTNVFGCHVSIHALLRGQTPSFFASFTSQMFQFMPSCEGRRNARLMGSRSDLFQFMPSCEGRHMPVARFFCTDKVSIHALLRGQTVIRFAYVLVYFCFNSCPLARADFTGDFAKLRRYSFNSCPLARADYYSRRSQNLSRVSIHALLRGQTYSNHLSLA